MREINITLGLLGVSCADTRLGQAGDAAVTQLNINVSALADGLTSPTYDLYYGIPGGTVLKAADTLTATDGVIEWIVPASACARRGDVRLQMDVLETGKRRRSVAWTMTVGEGLTAQGSAPAAVATWLDEVETAISSALAVAGAMSNDVTVNVEAGETASGTGSLTEDGLTLNLVVPTLQGAAGADGSDGQDGQDGQDGAAAGFGTPTATVEALAADGTPEVTIETSGADTSKVFAFTFKLPRGATGHSVGSIYLKSGNHAPGTTDTYGVRLNDAAQTEVGTISVYNGADGQGAGDMLKAIYDTDNDGTVDNAAQLGGHGADYFATAEHGHTAADVGATPTVDGLTAEDDIADADALPMYDASASAHRKITWASIKTVLGNVFAPSAHVATHAVGGTDALSPSDIGAAAASHGHAWSAVTDKPSTYAPSAHAAAHAVGGEDAITPSDIGAAAASHTQAASTITTGTFAGAVYANAAAASSVATSQVRNIYAGTSDMSAGTSQLVSGVVYFVYE